MSDLSVDWVADNVSNSSSAVSNSASKYSIGYDFLRDR